MGHFGEETREFYKPRAMTIGPRGLLYVVDKTGRIQVFDQEGRFQRGWTTPAVKNGKPCGLSFSNDGNLIVADTHYHRVLTYTPEGELLAERTIGGVCGEKPGEFGFVTRAVEDSRGNYYVGEYGPQDRLQKFDRNGKVLCVWGSHSASLMASIGRKHWRWTKTICCGSPTPPTIESWSMTSATMSPSW